MKRAVVLGACALGLLGALPAGGLAAEPVSRAPQGLLAARYVFPSSANTVGLYGAAFRTRMVLTNPTGSKITLSAVLSTDKGSGGVRSIVLEAWETRIFENFLQDVFQFSGGGGFSLAESSNSRSFFAVGEVWTEKDGARYGTPLVGMSIEDRIVNTSIGETGISLATGLGVDAANRANFGCANFDASPVDVRADFYVGTIADRSSPAKSVTFTLPANGWAQSAVPLAGGRILVLFTQLSSGGGSGTYCYGVNVNNLSNDGTSIPALYAPVVP